jgi:small subunit ribosomal protein S21
MPEVVIKDNESLEHALKRFRNDLQKSGIIKELKKREFYEKPSERKKKKLAEAKRRERLRLLKNR